MIDKDPNSRKVIIKRKITIGDHNQKEVEEMMGNSVRPIGPYWFGKKAASGLNYTEQNILMPSILNTEVGDRDFREKVDEYFHSITTRVPKDGVELEIGLMNNDEPISATNLPLEPVDYVAWKHAKGHPNVAASASAANGNPLIKWFIEDPELELTKEKELTSVRDKASQLYLINKDSSKVIDMVLDLSNVKASPNKKQLEFRKIADTNPHKFIQLIEDKDITLRYLVSQAITQGVLKRTGTAILWTESGDIIGHNMEEVLVYLKDKAKTPEVNRIKAALKVTIE